MANSSIYIKPSKRGTLRAALGTPKGQNIPVSKLQVKAGDSPAMKKKKIFAQNARKWNKEDGGNLLEPQPLPASRSGVLSDGQSPLLKDMFSGNVNYLQARANRDRLQSANFFGGLPSKALSDLKRDPEKFDRFYDYSKRRGEKKRTGVSDYMLRYNPEVDKPFSVPLGFSVPDAINRTSVRPSVTPEAGLPEFGFGSWLAGFAPKLASAIPVVGQIAGPVLQAGMDIIGGIKANKAAQADADAQQLLFDEQAAGQKKQQGIMDRQTRAGNIIDQDQISYGATFEDGGILGNDLMGQNPQIVDYSNGEKHGESAVGGIPVDARGNPATTSKQSAVGLTEKGEVTWNGYVFSDKLKTD